MTGTKFFSSVLLSILIGSLFVPWVITSQPPVVLDTLYVGRPLFPWRSDPTTATYWPDDELVMNVYETLIAMKGEVYWDFIPRLSTNVPVREDLTKIATSTDVNMTNPWGSNWSDGSVCVGWVDDHETGYLDANDVLYLIEGDGSYRTWFLQTFEVGPPVSVTLWRGRYTFHIRTNPTVNFFNETGHAVDTFDVYDAAFSFRRTLVQDPYVSYNYYRALFDQMDSDAWNPATTGDNATTAILAHLIDSAVEVSGNDLVINIGIPFPETEFKQILSQTWASIVSKEFSMSIGCWTGDLYTDSDNDQIPDWWTMIRRKPSPYDVENASRYVGTGPYHVALFDEQAQLVRLSKNAAYWLGWPSPGAKSCLETIEIQYMIDTWNRWFELMEGNLDMGTVWYPDILMPPEIPPDVKNITNLRSPYVECLTFAFTINQTSGFIGSGSFPNGIPTNFFNNTHVRKAFACAFNRTELPRSLDNSLWYSYRSYYWETSRPTPLIRGLYPDYHSGIQGYDINYDLAETELKNAVFDGQSVWDTGFNLTIPYCVSTEAYFFSELNGFFTQLSTYDGRSPALPSFSVNPCYVESSEYFSGWNNGTLPIFWWNSDCLFDAENGIREFMHSQGYASQRQNYTSTNGWGNLKDDLINQASRIPDGPERAAIYAQLEQIYIDECPSIPLTQSMHREFLKYWVRGWYFNPLSPPEYYHMWKENTCWADISGPAQGVSDGVCNMRDISLACSCFGARAPDPARTPPLDAKWGNGTYGHGCADINGDRRVDMRDISTMCAHFGHTSQP